MSDKPAFPDLPWTEVLGQAEPFESCLYDRATRRFIAACFAMQGLIAMPGQTTYGIRPDVLATSARQVADALLAELERTETKEGKP